jgi:hypothetical protein
MRDLRELKDTQNLMVEALWASRLGKAIRRSSTGSHAPDLLDQANERYEILPGLFLEDGKTAHSGS